MQLSYELFKATSREIQTNTSDPSVKCHDSHQHFVRSVLNIPLFTVVNGKDNCLPQYEVYFMENLKFQDGLR
jgi:hypothetical protein